MKHILYATAMLLLVVGCSKNEDISHEGNFPADGQVRISTTLAAMPSRAGGANAYAGTNLNLSVDYGADDKYTVQNVLWTTADAGTTWISATQILWKNATTATNIYAYAPHAAGAADITAVPFSVQADQSAGLTSSDLVGCIKTGFVPSTDLVNNMVNLSFNHKLSKLTLDISFGDHLGGTAAIERVTLTETLPSVSYNAITGAVSSASGTTTPIEMHPLGDNKYDVVLAPQTIAAGTQMITVILAGSAVKYRYTVPTGGHSFTTNTAYTMKLKVGKDKLELGGISISNWQTGKEIPGGEAEVIKAYLDPTFAAALEAAYFNKLKDDNDGNGKYIDLKDAEVMTAVKAMKYLYIFGKNITSLNGIEYFTGLTNLRCEHNNITTLDLSALTELRELNCGYNKLTNLNVSTLTNLESLYCSENQLKNLDMGNMKKLTSLFCYKNQLSTLDLSNLTDLERLGCADNAIKTLKLGNMKNMRELNCTNNQLATLDVGNLTNLESLRCPNNTISTLDVGNLANLKELLCNDNNIGTLDVGNLTNLTSLSCNNNTITILDVSKLTKLTRLECEKNNIGTLDVGNLTNLESIYCHNNNNITILDVSKLTNLEYLFCYNNNITILDVSNMTKLKRLYCSNNAISALDIRLIAKLTTLYCGKQKENLALNLTLTQEQYNTEWSDWQSHPNNKNVIANPK